MKKLAFYLAFITLSLNIQAQESQQKVKELEAKIENLNARVESLTRDNEEYKKALNIKNAPNFQMYENIKLSVESAEGNENTGEVIVKLTIYNLGPDSKFQCIDAKAIDYSGNAFKSYRFKMNNIDGKVTTFYRDVPGTIEFTFDKVSKSPNRFSMIILKVLGPRLDHREIQFRNIPVTWK